MSAGGYQAATVLGRVVGGPDSRKWGGGAVSAEGRRGGVILIGYGAIAKSVLKHLAAGERGTVVAGLLVRPGRAEEVRAHLAGGIPVMTELEEALAVSPALVVECAGHGAVREYGPETLRRGVDFAAVSVGALVDDPLRAALLDAARAGGAQLVVPSGAVAGLDGLAAARSGRLTRVTYVSRKPPRAWKGTPAEEVCDLDALTGATVLYEGTAREAAALYPKNANVAATIALAGRGLDATEVRLTADPGTRANEHRIEAEGDFGELSIVLRGNPSPDNPRTSMLVALSVVRTIENRMSAIIL